MAEGGVDTQGYQSVQTEVRNDEARREEAARTMTRIYKRDSALVISTLVLALLLGMSTCGNIVQGMQGIREIPYVVFIDQLGNHHPAIRLPDQEITVPEGMIIMTLIRWIECTRSIPMDTKVLADNWEMVREFTTNAAWTQIEPFYEQQLERRKQQRRVQITLPQVKLLAGSRTWVVTWEETAVEPSGAKVVQESSSWEAELTLADFSDKAARERRNLRLDQRNYRNLLGIAIHDIRWKQRPPLGQLTGEGQ
jgi:type IV secretory pathway TrbF-like protein